MIKTGTKPKQERSKKTRRKLIDAAIDCLYEMGYSRTTSTEIVRRAGVSRGSYLHLFGSKESLVIQSLEHLIIRQCEDIEKLAQRTQSRRVTETLFDLLKKNVYGKMALIQMELDVAGRTDPQLGEACKILSITVRESFNRLFSAIYGADTLQRRNVRATLELGLCALRGMMVVELINPQRVNPSVWAFYLSIISRMVDNEIEKPTPEAPGLDIFAIPTTSKA